MSLNYELAKELKDAGFEEEKFAEGHMYCGLEGCEKLIDPIGIDADACMDCGTGSLMFIYAPTLEELIEACKGINNDEVFMLVRFGSMWNAGYQWDGNVQGVWSVEGEGKSPAEAVARLWLQLNRKK